MGKYVCTFMGRQSITILLKLLYKFHANPISIPMEVSLRVGKKALMKLCRNGKTNKQKSRCGKPAVGVDLHSAFQTPAYLRTEQLWSWHSVRPCQGEGHGHAPEWIQQRTKVAVQGAQNAQHRNSHMAIPGKSAGLLFGGFWPLINLPSLRRHRGSCLVLSRTAACLLQILHAPNKWKAQHPGLGVACNLCCFLTSSLTTVDCF